MSPLQARFKASRPEFRRAGYVFGASAWTVLVDAGPELVARLLAEPVLVGERRHSDEAEWTPFTATDREGAASYLESLALGAQSEADEAGDIASLKAEHDTAIDQLKTDHQAEIDQMKADHAAQLAKIQTNPAFIVDLEAGTITPVAAQPSAENGVASGDAVAAEAAPADPPAQPASAPAPKPKPAAKEKPRRST